MRAIDVPAAHSMDTTWFAVDDDGVVAIFESSEDGAVPHAAASGGGAGDPSFDTFPLKAALFLRAGPLDDDGAERSPTTFEHPTRVVVVMAAHPYRNELGSLQPIAEEFPNAGFIPMRGPSAHGFVSTNTLSATEREALRERADVADVVREDELDVYELLYEAKGAVRYAHDYGASYEPGRYRRVHAAEATLELHDLPEPARSAVQSLKLPGHFRDMEQLHLADFMRDEDCAIWAETTLRGAPTREAVTGAAHVADPNKLVRVALALGVFILLVVLVLAKCRTSGSH